MSIRIDILGEVWIGIVITIVIIMIIIISKKNMRDLVWNRGARRLFHDTYLTIEVQKIRCTNHLHDSCPLTDVTPHFSAPRCRCYFKINSWWPIVTSSTHGPAASYCDVTMIHCSHGYLWTHVAGAKGVSAGSSLARLRHRWWKVRSFLCGKFSSGDGTA